MHGTPPVFPLAPRGAAPGSAVPWSSQMCLVAGAAGEMLPSRRETPCGDRRSRRRGGGRSSPHIFRAAARKAPAEWESTSGSSKHALWGTRVVTHNTAGYSRCFRPAVLATAGMVICCGRVWPRRGLITIWSRSGDLRVGSCSPRVGRPVREPGRAMLRHGNGTSRRCRRRGREARSSLAGRRSTTR